MSLAETPDFDIRYTRVEEMEQLRFWLNAEGMLHWYPPSNQEELETFIRIWIGFTRYSASLTATYQGEPVGISCLYLMPYRKVAHQALFQIVVDPERQRKGVGRSLLRNLKHLAKNYFKLELLNVEIFDAAPVIPLLQSLGFIELARQENYVKEAGKYYPRIVMEVEL